MNENSYLNPKSLTKQCDLAVKNLNRDNDSLDKVEIHFQSFISNQNLDGKAYRSLKQQLSDYKQVVQIMKDANEYDISDFLLLKNSIGNKVLDGGEIISMKNSAYSDYTSYEDKATKYNSYSDNSFWPWEKLYYSWKSNKYKNLSEQDYKIYKKYLEFENSYNQIEDSTKNLFKDSLPLRDLANTILSEISQSFHDGAYYPDMNAAWRTALNKTYIDMMTVDNEECIKPNWDMLKKILSRDADDITDQEYRILAYLYLNMNDEDTATLLQLCMDGKDIKEPLISKLQLNNTDASSFNSIDNVQHMREDYSNWTVDKDKINNILSRVSMSSDITLMLMQSTQNDTDIYSLLEEQRNQIIQRQTLLSVIQDKGEFRGEYGAQNPCLTLKRGDDNSLTLNFKECRFNNLLLTPTISNLGDSKITISDTRNGVNTMSEALKSSEVEFYGHFGDVNELKETSKFTANEIRATLTSTGADYLKSSAINKSASKLTVNSIGYIPLVGDTLEFAAELAIQEYKANEDNEFIKGEFKTLGAANIYSDFKCSTSFVSYDTSDKSNLSLYSYEGAYTQQIVDSVNKNLNTDFNTQDIITNPNKTFQKREKIFSENYRNDDLYNNTLNKIKTGAQ